LTNRICIVLSIHVLLPLYKRLFVRTYCVIENQAIKFCVVCFVVFPLPACDGLRRSKRVRVKPLEWYKNERVIINHLDKSGNLCIIVALEGN